MEETPIVALARAYHFAAAAHVNQRRKGIAAEPYVNHLTEVADLVATATRGTDPEIIIAAILHDTVEDTGTSLESVGAAFGTRVRGLVAEVTDDKTLPKQTRKDLQVEHAPHISRGAKIIKMADKISNLRALVTSPPPDWPHERKVEYVEWARRVVDGCRRANDWLSREFDIAAAAFPDAEPTSTRQ